MGWWMVVTAQGSELPEGLGFKVMGWWMVVTAQGVELSEGLGFNVSGSGPIR